MSLIQPASIQAIAETVDVTGLSDEAARALAPDVEYRLREVIQDALKFARQSKRTKLTTDDVNNALRLRNIEPVYGFLGSGDEQKFVRATGHPDLYFVQDRVVPLTQVIGRTLPKAPPMATVMPHWLFIDGVQPQTDENTPVDRPVAKRARLQQQAKPVQHEAPKPAAPQPAGPSEPAADGAAAAGPATQVALPVQHVLSDELLTLFEQIKAILKPSAAASSQPKPPGAAAAAAAAGQAGQQQQQQRGGGTWASSDAVDPLHVSPKQLSVLAKVQAEPGMQQLVPFFIKHVCDEVAGGLKSLPRLGMVLRLLGALLANPHVALEAYLAQMMPPILTCLLAKSMGGAPVEDHWTVRDRAASLLATVCGRYGEPYYALQVKVSKQLLKTFLDTSKPLPSHYGAVQGLAALGHATVRLLLLPQLEPYMAALHPLLGTGERHGPHAALSRPREAAQGQGQGQGQGSEQGQAGGSGKGGRGVKLEPGNGAGPSASGAAGAGPSNGAAPDGGSKEAASASGSGGTGGASTSGALALAAPAMVLTGASASPVRQYEAWRVYGALLDAISGAVYDKILSMAADSLPYHLFSSVRRTRTAKELQAAGKLPELLNATGTANGTSGSGRRGGASGRGNGGRQVEHYKGPPPALTPEQEEENRILLLGGSALASALMQGQLAAVQNKFTVPQQALLMGLAYGKFTIEIFKKYRTNDVQMLVTAAGKAVSSQARIQLAPIPVQYDQLIKQFENIFVPTKAVYNVGTCTHDATAAGPDQPGVTMHDAATGPEPVASTSDAGVGTAAGAAGVAGALATVGVPARSVRAILADAWRDDADMGETLWALSEVLGEPFLARMPQPGRLPAMLI